MELLDKCERCGKSLEREPYTVVTLDNVVLCPACFTTPAVIGPQERDRG